MSERHAAGQPWDEFLAHLDAHHWGSRDPRWIGCAAELQSNRQVGTTCGCEIGHPGPHRSRESLERIGRSGRRRSEHLGYHAIHKRLQRILPNECAKADLTCTGRLEVALRKDVPAERLQFSSQGTFLIPFSILESDYQRLCTSHHKRQDARGSKEHQDEVSDPDYIPAFIPADEPLPEEEFEATPDGYVYLAAMDLGAARIRLDLIDRILDRLLAEVRDG